MLRVERDARLKPLNTMGIDGTAAALVTWDTADDLHEFFTSADYASLSGLPCKAIGQGSNVLFTVYRYDGVLLKCGNESVATLGEADGEVTLRVGAGCALDDLVSDVCSLELWGAENLSLIPGTVAGAAVQNAGAYGVEMSSLVMAVHCYDREERRETVLGLDEMGYRYRDSALKHAPLAGRMIVTAVDVKVSRSRVQHLSYGNLYKNLHKPAERLTPADVRRAVIETRRAKLPDVGVTGSCGSFFKNPVVSQRGYRQVLEAARNMYVNVDEMPAHEAYDENGDPGVKLSAAWLIDKSGWRGYRRWNVGTWPEHALVLTNVTGMAAGLEVTALAADIIADVAAKWGVTLAPEVEYLR